MGCGHSSAKATRGDKVHLKGVTSAVPPSAPQEDSNHRGNVSKYCILFVLGGPGSGKGTQCERIAAKYKYVHLSAGDLLRDEVKRGLPLGKDIEGIMKEGKLVPTEVIVRLLRETMQRSSGDRFLIDGFPRALPQAQEFERAVKPPDLVIFLDCPEEVMLQRLLNRAQTSGRADDNEETARKRFQTYLECTLPVIEHYEDMGKVARISAVPPPDEVFAEVEKALQRVPCHEQGSAQQEQEALAA